MTLIYFILILGITVMIHETGHFLFAKKSGVYVYEYSIGMGPRLFKWKRKNDETEYSIRLLPIGGYVQLAGENLEDADNSEIPKGKRLQEKSFIQNLSIMVAGVLFNFILAITVFFVIGLFNGYTNTIPEIASIAPDSPAEYFGLAKGDIITKVNGTKVNNIDRLMLELALIKDENVTLEIKRLDKIEEIKVVAKKTVDEKNNSGYMIGFTLNQESTKGILPALRYAFTKFFSLIEQMVFILIYLFTGKLSLSNLSGPVGIYTLVGETSKQGLLNLIYLMGYLSLNVGFINILPFPAFDGGRVFLLIIEKIRGKKNNPKVENTINTVGFALLMLLMLVVTVNDISKFFK